jgi:flagellar hook-length control protein FliK
MSEEAMVKGKGLPAEETSPDGKLKSLDAGTSTEGINRSGNKELSERDSERHSFEQSIDFGQNGLFDRLAGTRTVSTADISNASDMIRLKMIVNQIVDQIRLSVTKDNASLQMALHPDWLGKVSLTVESKEGAMTARFVVSNETAKEAIESNIQVLKDTLSEQGLKVEDIEVTVAANGFDSEDSTGREGQAAQQKRSRGQRLAADGNAISSWEPEVEVGNADIDPALGSNIDMTA